MNPSPPTSLTKETIRVWYGWTGIGDKEVAREAAVKGLHVNLAITFLSHRRKIDESQAHIWFKEEVIKWVSELLERRQIFKASHILHNINVDAVEVFSKFFYTTPDKDLREYIGNHLMKIERLDENLQYLWIFLNLILENAVFMYKYKLLNESLECLDSQSDLHKSELATILFLKTEDTRLSKFLHGETLWKYLLMNNDLHNLLLWINIRYKGNDEDIVEGNMVELFKKFQITNDMLNLITSQELNVPSATKNVIYNELSIFGIFSTEEKTNFILLLERLKNSFSIGNLYEIFAKNQSVLDIDNFIHLLIEYCLEQNLPSVLNICIKDFKIPPIESKDLNLIREFRLLVDDFSEFLLRKNIFNVANMLSCDIPNYFDENPILLLTLLFFTKDIDILNVVLGETLVIDEIRLSNCVLNMVTKFQMLHHVCLSRYNKRNNCILKVSDLIDKHLKISTENLFEFRFLNTDLFSFYTVDVQNYGYSKKLDYIFYVKQSRPSIALKFLTFSETFLNEETFKKTMEKKIYKVGISNFDCDEICSSCISCMELSGIDSSKLRVLINIAQSLFRSRYEKVSLLDLLIHSEDEPYTLQNVFEKLLIEIIEATSFVNGTQLIETFQLHENLIQYSKMNNIKLPELFLKYCASRNLYLPFLLFAQIYDYPLDQIKLLIQFFKSPNMLEHLTHGVVNEMPVEEKNVPIRDSRKYLLSKVGVYTTVDLTSQYSLHSIKSLSSYESEESSTSSDTFEIDISNIKATLLQTLIRCHNSTDPPKAFLQACQLYRNPLLAIFATSYEPDSVITNWLTWLSVSCELCKVFTNYETTAISAKCVSNLLQDCMKYCYPRTLLESFEIFLPVSHVNSIPHLLSSTRRLLLQNIEGISNLIGWQKQKIGISHRRSGQNPLVLNKRILGPL